MFATFHHGEFPLLTGSNTDSYGDSSVKNAALNGRIYTNTDPSDLPNSYFGTFTATTDSTKTTYIWTPYNSGDADVLLVAGGGGGGCGNGGGGGGGGGVVQYSQSLQENVPVTIVVGNGGSGGPAPSVKGVNGSDSSLNNIIAKGGGGGGSRTNSGGVSGGSGGGGARLNGAKGGSTQSTNNVSLALLQFGNDSGIGKESGAGGGGAGGAGTDALDGISYIGRDGGNGVTFTQFGNNLIIVGAGGGSGNTSTGTSADFTLGVGGSGIGGNGGILGATGNVPDIQPPTAGKEHTGSGGGGSGGADTGGADGGSGIVLIMYRDTYLPNTFIQLDANEFSETRVDNTPITSWNGYAAEAVGNAGLPVVKTDEPFRYVRFGTPENSATVGNYLDVGDKIITRENPAFTSDTTVVISDSGWDTGDGWVVSASSVFQSNPIFNAWKGFDKSTILGANDDCWLSSGFPTSSSPQWLRIKYPYPVSISYYDITTRGIDTNTRFPTIWVLQGSNDDNVEVFPNNNTLWVNLEVERTESSWLGDVTKTFSDGVNVENNQYKYYQLLIKGSRTDNNTSTTTTGQVAIANLTLNTTSKTQTWFGRDTNPAFTSESTVALESNSGWNTNIGWKAAASSTLAGYPSLITPAWKGFNKTILSTGDCWHSDITTPSVENQHWLSIEYPYPVSISSYDITSRNDSGSVWFPTKWVLQGSNVGTPDGLWIDLEEERNISAWNSAETKTFSVGINIDNNAYKYYRLLIRGSRRSNTTTDVGYVAIGNWSLNMRPGFTAVGVIRFWAAKTWQRWFDFGNGPAQQNILYTKLDSDNVGARFDILNRVILDTTDPYVVPVGNGWHIVVARATTLTDSTLLETWSDPNSALEPKYSQTGAASIFTKRTLINNYIGKSNWHMFGDAYSCLDVRETAFYDYSLSDSDLKNLVTHLRLKYGFDPSLPTSGPISLADVAGLLQPGGNINMNSIRTRKNVSGKNKIPLSGQIKMSDFYGLGYSGNPTSVPSLYAWYNADSFVNGQWEDASGNGRHATVTGTVSVVTSTDPRGNSVNALVGDTTASVAFPDGVLPETFTMFHLTRYTGGARKRIFQGVNNDWVDGFNNGKSGVAFHGKWLTQNNSSSFEGDDDWVLSCSQNNMYRANGIQKSILTSSGISQNIAINTGKISSQASDWACAEVIVYDRHLSVEEIDLIERHIRNANGIEPKNGLSGLSTAGFDSLVAAYSFHRCNQNYSGPAVRVQKGTEEMDFYPTTSGVLHAGSRNSAITLSDWLGSSTGLIHTWYDQSGRGKHASGGTDKPQILLSADGICMHKSGTQSLTGPNVFDTTDISNMHWVIASKKTTTGYGNFIRFLGGTGRFDIEGTGNDNQWYSDFGDSTNNRAISGSEITEIGENTVYSGYKDALMDNPLFTSMNTVVNSWGSDGVGISAGSTPFNIDSEEWGIIARVGTGFDTKSPWKAFDKNMTQGRRFYADFITGIGIRYPMKVYVYSYTFTTGQSGSYTSTEHLQQRSPTYWNIEGSDDGLNWTVVQSYTKTNWPRSFLVITLPVNPVNAYTHWRMRASSSMRSAETGFLVGELIFRTRFHEADGDMYGNGFRVNGGTRYVSSGHSAATVSGGLSFGVGSAEHHIFSTFIFDQKLSEADERIVEEYSSVKMPLVRSSGAIDLYKNTGTVAAYALRQLFSTYTGPQIRVKIDLHPLSGADLILLNSFVPVRGPVFAPTDGSDIVVVDSSSVGIYELGSPKGHIQLNSGILVSSGDVIPPVSAAVSVSLWIHAPIDITATYTIFHLGHNPSRADYGAIRIDTHGSRLRIWGRDLFYMSSNQLTAGWHSIQFSMDAIGDVQTWVFDGVKYNFGRARFVIPYDFTLGTEVRLLAAPPQSNTGPILIRDMRIISGTMLTEAQFIEVHNMMSAPNTDATTTLDVSYDKDGREISVPKLSTFIPSNETAHIVTWYDQSGKNNHGTAVNNPVLDYTTSPLKHFIKLESSSTHPYIEVPANLTTDLIINDSQIPFFTYVAFKGDDLQFPNTLLSRGTGNTFGSAETDYRFWTGGEGTPWAFETGAGSALMDTDIGGGINEPCVMAGSHVPALNKKEFYLRSSGVNAYKLANTVDKSTLVSNTNPMRIGHPTWGFAGDVYEVLIYRADLTAGSSPVHDGIMNNLVARYVPSGGALDDIVITDTTAVTVAPIYTTASVAYSVRRLFTEYTGPQIRVRHSVTSTQADIYTDSHGKIVRISGSTATDLDTWLNSATATADVLVWYDQSGGDIKHASSYGTNEQPKLEVYEGKLAIRFNGTTERLNFADTDVRGVYMEFYALAYTNNWITIFGRSRADKSFRVGPTSFPLGAGEWLNNGGSYSINDGERVPSATERPGIPLTIWTSITASRETAYTLMNEIGKGSWTGAYRGLNGYLTELIFTSTGNQYDDDHTETTLSTLNTVHGSFYNTRYTLQAAPAPLQRVLATGGTVTDVGGYRIHEFTYNQSTPTQTFTVTSEGVIDVIIVGGGGSGGTAGSIPDSGGGGGGAGGIIESYGISVSSVDYDIVVGNGGAGVNSEHLNGNNGTNSSAFELNAKGGGGGGSGLGEPGQDGGSGGGGGTTSGGTNTLPGNALQLTPPQGNHGGTSINGGGGGGGGGATQIGLNATGGIPGKGGDGITTNFIPNSSKHLAGGGGGYLQTNIYGTGGLGGGGGGNAANINGLANTGGGGAGGNDGIISGNGGSGIVLIRYLL